jgi:hypothetical protein
MELEHLIGNGDWAQLFYRQVLPHYVHLLDSSTLMRRRIHVLPHYVHLLDSSTCVI